MAVFSQFFDHWGDQELYSTEHTSTPSLPSQQCPISCLFSVSLLLVLASHPGPWSCRRVSPVLSPDGISLLSAVMYTQDADGLVA